MLLAGAAVLLVLKCSNGADMAMSIYLWRERPRPAIGSP
jgi:hypothetical protein